MKKILSGSLVAVFLLPLLLLPPALADVDDAGFAEEACLAQVSDKIQCQRDCCIDTGGTLLRSGETNPHRGLALLEGDPEFACGFSNDDAFFNCYDGCADRSDATFTPTPPSCNFSLSASPSTVQPGNTTSVTVYVVYNDGTPVVGAAVNHYISAGPGSLISGSPVTDAEGKFTFDYYAPADPEGATSATIAVEVADCNVIQSITIPFGNPPTATLTPTPTASATSGLATPVPVSDTPTPTPPPAPPAAGGRLVINKIVLLQAIEHGVLIGGRDIGLRAYFEWTGSQPVTLEGVAQVDGVEIARREQQFNNQRHFDVILPGSHFGIWSELNHQLVFDLNVKAIGGNPPPTPLSASQAETFRTYAGRPFRAFYVSMDPAIGLAQINRLASEAQGFYNQVYPVPFTTRVRNAAYLVQQNWLSSLKVSWLISLNNALSRYNSERCRDHLHERITDCDTPRADFIVGIFKEGAFDAGSYSVAGFASSTLRRPLSALANDDSNHFNVAHELGHLFGLGDEYSGTSPGIHLPEATHLMSRGRIFIAPYQRYISFMGNAGGPPTWVNHETWNMLQHLASSGRGVAALPGVHLASGAHYPASLIVPSMALSDNEIEGRALFIQGIVENNGAAQIVSASWVAQYPQIDPPGGVNRVVAWDPLGTRLADISIVLSPLSLSDAEEQLSVFSAFLPVPEGAMVAMVSLEKDGEQIAALTRSPSAPQVEFTGISGLEGEKATITWNASDPDGDALTSTLLYSSDGGKVWQVLGVDLVEQVLEIDPQALSGGEARFRLIVSDGLNETAVITDAFDMEEKAPEARIEPVEDFIAGDPIRLYGSGYDLEDGEIDNLGLAWFDENGAQIAFGRVLDLEGLAPGDYVYSLTATDSSGQQGTVEVSFRVATSPDAPPPATEAWRGWVTSRWFPIAAMALILFGLGGLFLVALIGPRRPGIRWMMTILIPAVLCGVSAIVASWLIRSGMMLPEATPAPEVPASAAQIEAFQVQAALAAEAADQPAPTPTPTWRIQRVDGRLKHGLHSSLVFDVMGNPHIAYSSGGPDTPPDEVNLYYSAFDGSAWQIENVHEPGAAGSYPSLDIAPDGRPQIAYLDGSRVSLAYAWRAIEGWQNSIIDQSGQIGGYTSFDIDESGRPFVVYWNRPASDLRYLALADVAGDWQGGTVYEEGEVGEFGSLAIDAAGHPHVSFFDRTNFALRYATHNGIEWQHTIVDDAGDVGPYTSIALDSEGRPHISYFDSSSQDLKYAFFDGTTWQIETVDRQGSAGRSTSIALDSNDRPHISYLTVGTFTLKYAHHNGLGWVLEVVDDQVSFEGWEGTSIALDSLGQPHISYYSEDGLRLASKAVP